MVSGRPVESTIGCPSTYICCWSTEPLRTTWCHCPSLTAADEVICRSAAGFDTQNPPRSSPSCPTYSTGAYDEGVVPNGWFAELSNTPPVVVLNQSSAATDIVVLVSLAGSSTRPPVSEP